MRIATKILVTLSLAAGMTTTAAKVSLLTDSGKHHHGDFHLRVAKPKQDERGLQQVQLPSLPFVGDGHVNRSRELQGTYGSCNACQTKNSLNQCVADTSKNGNSCGSDDNQGCCSGGVCNRSSGAKCCTDDSQCNQNSNGCDAPDTCDKSKYMCVDKVKDQGTLCRPAVVGGCDLEEVCDGTSKKCPDDSFQKNTTVCRQGGCYKTKYCSGKSNKCPSDDMFELPNTPCGDNTTTLCDNPDTCDGSGNCRKNVVQDSTPCGTIVKTNGCEKQDVCISGVCQDKGYESDNTPCATNPSNSCNKDGVCTNGQCHVPDTCGPFVCDGNFGSGCVTDDGMKGCCAGTGNKVCTALPWPMKCCTKDGDCNDNNDCTRDYCHQGTGICTFEPKPVDTSCGDNSADKECDAPDKCNGHGQCIKQFKAFGATCGSQANSECDKPDICDGSGTCLKNLLPSGSYCGDYEEECRNQDTCDGNGKCVDNGFKNKYTTCGQLENPNGCSGQDTCDGAGKCLPNDKPANTPCGDITKTDCHNPDTCNGQGLCIPNFLAAGTVCQATGTGCQLDKCNSSCDGAGRCRITTTSVPYLACPSGPVKLEVAPDLTYSPSNLKLDVTDATLETNKPNIIMTFEYPSEITADTTFEVVLWDNAGGTLCGGNILGISDGAVLPANAPPFPLPGTSPFSVSVVDVDQSKPVLSITTPLDTFDSPFYHQNQTCSNNVGGSINQATQQCGVLTFCVEFQAKICDHMVDFVDVLLEIELDLTTHCDGNNCKEMNLKSGNVVNAGGDVQVGTVDCYPCDAGIGGQLTTKQGEPIKACLKVQTNTNGICILQIQELNVIVKRGQGSWLTYGILPSGLFLVNDPPNSNPNYNPAFDPDGATVSFLPPQEEFVQFAPTGGTNAHFDGLVLLGLGCHCDNSCSSGRELQDGGLYVAAIQGADFTVKSEAVAQAAPKASCTFFQTLMQSLFGWILKLFGMAPIC